MKTNPLFSLPLLCLCLLLGCRSPIRPEELAHSVLDAFRDRDVEKALRFILYEEDYEDFYSNSSLAPAEKERLISKHCNPDYVKVRVERFRKRFEDILNEGEAMGIVWNTIVFDSISGPDPGKTMMGLKADEIYVFFSSGSKIFKLTLDDCYFTSRGWLMSDEPRLSGPVESDGAGGGLSFWGRMIWRVDEN